MAASPANPLGNPAVHRDPLNRIPNQVDTKFINASSVMTHGIDLELGYRDAWFGPDGRRLQLRRRRQLHPRVQHPQGPGRRRASENAAATPATSPAFATRPTSHVRSRAFAPRCRSLVAGRAQRRRVSATSISGYKDDEPQVPPVMVFPDVDPFFTFDLQYSYRIDEGDGQGTTFRVGVLNLAGA